MAKVLIIDDDPFIREMLRLALEEAGHNITEAGDGDQGLSAQREAPAQVVITDILMPGKEGIATIRELVREFPDVRLIAISGGGLTGKDYLPLAEALGVAHTFKKPFPMKDLVQAVESLS